MAILRERNSVLKDVIEKYRDRPLLWDQTHELYGNKIARREGYDQLLEIYRSADPDATKQELKRKLDNLRTYYRRERVKVLSAERSGKQYVPTLWYYPLFTFIPDLANCGSNNPDLPTQSNVRAEGKEEEEEEEEEEDEMEDREEVAHCSLKSDSPPPRKKKKTNQIFCRDALAVDCDPCLISTDNDQCNHTTEKLSSTESFGKTVGLQLNELEPMQKCIAEKLISDVIFYGRLNKLQPETKIT